MAFEGGLVVLDTFALGVNMYGLCNLAPSLKGAIESLGKGVESLLTSLERAIASLGTKLSDGSGALALVGGGVREKAGIVILEKVNIGDIAIGVSAIAKLTIVNIILNYSQ